LDALARLGINPIYLLSQIVVFAVLAFLLSKLLYNPVLNMLEKRKDRIAKGLEDARAAEEARAKADEAAAEIMEEARKKAQQVVAEASNSAEQVRANIRVQAEEEARGIMAQAREDAQLERNKILAEMRGQIGLLAMAAAQKIVGETLDQKRQLALVQEFFSGIRAGKIAVLEDVRLAGESAVVTSALPLDAEEQASYKSILKAHLGAGTEVAFRTDPSILGGVTVQVGAQVLDDSVAGKLDELKGRLATR
jgi:F-type H+-transporting ATPase subunit b